MNQAPRQALGGGAEAVPLQPVKKRVRLFKARVIEVVRETADTVTIVLDPGTEPRDYKAGQFVTWDPKQHSALAQTVHYLEAIKGRRELPRAYSLASAPHEPHLAITIKEETFRRDATPYPPLLSPFLVRDGVRPGDELLLTGFTGPYVLPFDIEERTDHLIHVVAGSGSVPNFSILKDALHRGLQLRHTFLYSNKTWDDACYRDALTELQARHPDRVRVIHTLTRETDPARFGGDVRQGRLSESLLREVLGQDPRAPMVYLCGPAVTPHERSVARAKGEPPTPRFLEGALSLLVNLEVPSERIKRESYG